MYVAGNRACNSGKMSSASAVRASIVPLVAPLVASDSTRTVAVARITMPLSMVRLSAGRESMSDAGQALAFLAGANSIFSGDKLLTTANAGDDRDSALFERLGIVPMAGEEPMRELAAAE